MFYEPFMTVVGQIRHTIYVFIQSNKWFKYGEANRREWVYGGRRLICFSQF